MAYIDQFFEVLIQAGASDFHMAQGQPPKIRRHGEVIPIREEVISQEEAAYMLSEIAGPERWARYEETGDLDFAYEMDEESRFRCNFLKQTHGYGAVFRLIPTKIATLEQLGIPPVVKEFGHLRGGLVLVTGPTGSGKSTTLAALIDYINSNFPRHIITIEEPIEFVHNNKKSIITQREVPEHTESFPHRPESGAARGCRHRARRRNARPRNHPARAHRCRNRACSSSARCTPTTRAKPSIV